jgi:hypothetical protein
MMAFGCAAQPPLEKDMRDLEDMIHYDACGPDVFRTVEEIEADTLRFSDWCRRAH